MPEAEVERYKAQKKKIDALNEILTDYLAEQTKQLTDLLARDTARYLVAVWKGADDEPGLDKETIARWKKYLSDSNKEHPYLKPWYDLLAGKPAEAQVKQEAERYQQFLLQLLDEAKEVDDKNYVAFGGKKGLKDERTRQYTNIVSLPVLKFYQWREIANGPYNIDGFKAPGGVLFYGSKEIDRFLGGIAKAYAEKLRAEIKDLEKDLPPLYPFVHALKDAEKPADIKVAIRGDTKTLGEVAPRRFLQMLMRSRARAIQGGQRARSIGASDRQRVQSSYCPRDGESNLAVPLRQGHRTDSLEFRPDGRTSHTSGIARLSRSGLRFERMEYQEATSQDSALQHVRAGHGSQPGG